LIKCKKKIITGGWKKVENIDLLHLELVRLIQFSLMSWHSQFAS